MNTITVSFAPCDPAPANGYNLLWRVAGSSDPYTDEGNFFTSPIQFTDSINPDGTDYEGIIRSDCSESGESGSNFGNPIPWTTFVESGTTVSGNVTNISGGLAQIDSMDYGGISLNYVSGDTLPMEGSQGGYYTLPYTTTGDTFSMIMSGGAFTQVKITDNAGDHILPYVGPGLYQLTLTLNPMFVVFSVEVS